MKNNTHIARSSAHNRVGNFHKDGVSPFEDLSHVATP